MKPIQMLDLKSQYLNIKQEIDESIQEVLDSTAFINGQPVRAFNEALAQFHNVSYAQSCGNGTDALQIALMALDLKAGDEIILPAFTYFATVEVALLLGLKPIFVDVDAQSFNINTSQIEAAIGDKTKAIIVVHLFGQSADMEAILKLATEYKLQVIEDNAQSIGGSYTFSNGNINKTGTMGAISCTSFFPSKNLGCYGDGGALCTNDEVLYERIKMIANHGQKEKYKHDIVGVNSRLDTMQAAILNIKLKHLDAYNNARLNVAIAYNLGFQNNGNIITPVINEDIKHVFHQYTIQLSEHIDRDALKAKLASAGIPSMVYYHIPCHQQKALLDKFPIQASFPVAEKLCKTVLSLPMHTEMEAEQIQYIIEKVNFYTK